MSGQQPYSRDETTGARLDRNFSEQLQEVRIAQAGVQILFAFLLTIPFQQRFGTLTTVQRNLYLVAFISAAISVIVFTAPVATHRILFRAGVKDFIVSYTDRLTGVGLATLAVAILGSTVLVLELIGSQATAFSIGAALALLAVVLWVGVPLWRRSRAASDHPPQA